MLHHNIILDSNGHGGWKVYPLSSESELNYQRIRSYINSCNGLLLFTDRSDGEFRIYNPTTNECKAIPLPPVACFTPPGFSTCWGFSGLGFDSRSNDYRFMVFVDHVSTGGGVATVESYAELYSLKTDSWRSLTTFPNILFTDPCVYADGSIYWRSHPNFAIDSFDFADETFSSFDISPFLQPADYYRVRLSDDCACGGSQLRLVAHKRNLKHSPCRFEVWVIKTSTSTSAAGWNIHKRWDFSLPQIFMDLQLPRYLAFGVIIIGFSGEIMYLADSYGEAFAYDCAAGHLERLQIRLRKYTDQYPVFIAYVETTVRLSL